MPPYNINEEEGHVVVEEEGEEEEGDDCDMGCAEIEVAEDGGIHIRSVAPQDCPTSPLDTSHCSLVDLVEEEEGEEGIEVPDLMTFFDAFLGGYGCSGCEPCAPECVARPPPGILKHSRYTTALPNTPSPLNKRTVSFSQLEIKEFKMSLGDHPCSSSGPPVRLDWDAPPMLERVVSLDDYERMRSPRRSRQKLKLSYRDRKGILAEGYTTEEVNQAWAEAIKIRQQRHETLKRGPLLNVWDDVYESWQRKCHRVVEAVGLG